MNSLAQINLQHLPAHIAIIMDGNGRWAQEQGNNRLFGHMHGVESVRDIVEGAAEIGIQYLTLYTFSTENWDRPADEVNGLMELLVDTIKKEVPTLNKNNIRLHVIGHTERLPAHAREQLNEALKDTAANNGLQLIMALSYSSRTEMVDAVKNIAASVKNNELAINAITPETITQHLSTSDFPEPALLIRTGGDYRISNFLLYQIAYTELYFTETMWPAFRKEDLHKAIIEFQRRERRFGKTGDQIKGSV
ncbi:isoprenyl transferase [Ferruginibacter yonginensis]|uniref:Isoprenyl transferase n=1 Tax=Ferruginibacter yonginensis TaxID=1310416 RepID=A0ABV8QST3_9BACT